MKVHILDTIKLDFNQKKLYKYTTVFIIVDFYISGGNPLH